MRRKFLLFAVSLFSMLLPAKGQMFYTASEWGISVGGAQYFGDLNDNYGFHYVRPALGIFGRYHANHYISLRGTLSYTKVGYDDKYAANAFNKRRNLSFRSDIMEAAVQAEFNFSRFATGEPESRFTPYLTGGIGVFYYNPYAFYNGSKYYLRPLGTEGQNVGYNDRKYSNFSACVPIGVGFKYWLMPGFNFGLEIADRLTFTDYVDDVSTTYVGADKFPSDPKNPNPAYVLQDPSIPDASGNPIGQPDKQRGNSQTKDQYLYLIINFSFQFKTYKCPSYYKNGQVLY
jgi:hypothetical protein